MGVGAWSGILGGEGGWGAVGGLSTECLVQGEGGEVEEEGH